MDQHVRTNQAEPEVGPGADLVGMDLSGRDLSGADLRGAHLDGADLSGAKLLGANLQGASLVEADLTDAQLLGADLRDADASSVSAERLGLGKADCSGASFFGADLRDAALSHAVLDGADLRTARLDGARLREVQAVRGDFSRASLTSADLTRAMVRKSVFRDADLTRARLKGLTDYHSADWVGVDIMDVNFAGAYMARRVIMDQNFLWEFRHRSRKHAAIYQLWRFTSDCGRSFGRWAITTAVLALAFGIAFALVEVDYGSYQTALSPFYYSVVTLTTLGYGDVLPASVPAQVIAMVEVVMGHVMLGGLLSIFATKMGRRAE